MSASIGDLCHVIAHDGYVIEAEVVGFSDDTFFLMPMTSLEGIQPGSRVVPLTQQKTLCINEDLIGRVLDGTANPLDYKGNLKKTSDIKKYYKINPLDRSPIKVPLDVGIRAINSLLTVGKGQRIGLFAGSIDYNFCPKYSGYS